MGILTRAMAAAAALSAAGLVSAGTAPAASITVSHSIGGRATAGVGPSAVIQPFSDIQSRTVMLESGDKSTNTSLTGNASGAALDGGSTALGEINSTARARIGSVGVKLEARAFGVNEPNNAGIGTINLSNVSAGFMDTLEFSTDEFPPGFLVLVKATLKLSQTDLFATVTGGPVGGFRGGRAETILAIEPTGFIVTPPQGGNRFAYAVDNLGHTENDIVHSFTEYPIAITFINEQPVERGIKLTIIGQAVASSQLINAGSVTAKFANDSSKTLNWGGVTEVLNPETGAPITNWTLTSESGFDYTKPFPLPEPAGLALLAGAALILARFRPHGLAGRSCGD